MPRTDSRNQRLSVIWSGVALSLVLLSSAVQARDQGPDDSFAIEAVNYIRKFAFPKQLKAPKSEILFERPMARASQVTTDTKLPPSDVGAASPPPTPAPLPPAGDDTGAAPAPSGEEKQE